MQSSTRLGVMWLGVFLILVCVPHATSLSVSGTLPQVRVSILASLHYDPFSGRPGGYGVCNQAQSSLANPGCDSSLKLIRSVLDDVAKSGSSITLITGGLLRHGTSGLTVSEFETMTRDVVKVLAETHNKTEVKSEKKSNLVQLALGGADFIPQDRFPFNKKPNANPVVNFLEMYGLMSSGEKSNILSGGYFYRDLANSKIRIICINTLLWSRSLKPPLSVGDVDPRGQFPFLHAAIEEAGQRGRNVIIVGDVPPVVNLEAAVRENTVEDADYYWRDDFREAYFRIIATYRFTVAAQFFGNSTTFSFVISSEVGSPLYIVPPISPVKGSNPSYLQLTLDGDTGRVVELKQRYLAGNGTWVEGGNLENTISMPLATMDDQLIKDFLLFMENEKRWENFAAMRVGGRFLTHRKPCGLRCRRIILCASFHLSKKSIKNCASVDLPSQSVGEILAIAFTLVGVLSIMVSGVCIVIRRRVIFDPPVVLGAGKGRRLLFSDAAE